MNILFVTRPILGHLLPALGISQQLQRLGHNAFFSSTPRFQRLIEEAGVAYLPSLAPEMNVSDNGSFESLSSEIQSEFHGEDIVLDESLRQIRDHRVDLLVCDCSIAAPSYAAEKSGIPWVSLGLGAFHFELNDPNDPEANPVIRRFMARSLNRLRQTCGLARLQDDLRSRLSYQGLSPSLHLIACDRVYEQPLPESFVFVGPVRFDLPAAWQKRRFLNETPKKPLLLVTSHTYENPQFLAPFTTYLQTIRDGLQNEDVNVLISAPPHLCQAAGPFPTNFFYQNTYQFEALPYAECDLVITHGGNGSYGDALLHGKPVLMIPIGWDASFNANDCQQQGNGKVLPLDTLAADQVRQAVHSILQTPVYLDAAQARKRSPTAASPVLVAAAHIASLLERQKR